MKQLLHSLAVQDAVTLVEKYSCTQAPGIPSQIWQMFPLPQLCFLIDGNNLPLPGKGDNVHSRKDQSDFV